MKKYLKIVMWIALFIIVIFLVSLLYNNLKANYNKEAELVKSSIEDTGNDKTKAVDFTVYSGTDEEVTLYSKIGKPMVINFWASWCPPCKSELPDFQKVYEEMNGEVEFMMINLTDGYQETKESATQFIGEKGYTFPVYFDTQYNAANAYAIRSIPTTYFIDENGYIVSTSIGAIDKQTLLDGIKQIQAEQK